MKAEIIIEQFDNGITIKWSDPDKNVDPHNIVALERDVAVSIGKTIWEDVSIAMNKGLTSKIKMKVEYLLVEE